MFRKRGGGGYLDGTSGEITGLTFETKEWTEGKKPYTTINGVLTLKADGADDDVTQYLPAGFFYPSDYSISEDETTILSADGDELEETNFPLQEGTQFARFVETLIERGFPESDLPKNGSSFAAVVGTRVTFGKEQDVEQQMAAGKKALGKKAATASDEEIMKAGREKDKKDKTKSYDRKRLIVNAVISTPEENKASKKSSKSAKSSKPAAKETAKAAPKGKSKKSDGDAECVEMLLAILGDAKDNTILRSQVSGKVTAYCMDNDIDDDTREERRLRIYSEDFLATEQGWTFDKDNRKQPISLAD